MNITPNKLTIGQLLGNQNEQFIIPAYQRRYAWGNNQTKALFDDIKLLKESDGHLFGMLILHTGFHTGSVNKAELVDGQQRMTTISILLMAIRDRYAELKNEEKISEILKMLVFKSFDDIERNKLVLGDLDNEDYVRLLKTTGIEKIKNENLLNAYNNFCGLVNELDVIELNKFYYKLLNIAVIIRLDVAQAQDAYKLFETINNRGLKLSPTDLIKNFLLGHAAKLNITTLEEVKSLWSEIIISLDKLDTDAFFRQYMCAVLSRKLSMSALVEEFKKHYFKYVKDAHLLGEFSYYMENETDQEEEDDENKKSEPIIEEDVLENQKLTIKQFVQQIGNASSAYKKILNQEFSNGKINRHLNNLERILSMPSYIYLMMFFQKDYSTQTQIKVLKIIEAFMLRRHICEARTSEHDDIFAKLVKIEGENIIEKIKEYLEAYLPEDIDFKEKFPKHNFKGKLIDRAKYVLEQIEYCENGDTGEYTINSGNEVHLEHIIPEVITTKKSKAEFGDWVDYLGENAVKKHPNFIHRIGNMTLIAGTLNISALNNPFLSKKKCYNKSNLTLTKELAEKYSNFKYSHVEKRGEELANKALEIWRF